LRDRGQRPEFTGRQPLAAMVEADAPRGRGLCQRYFRRTEAGVQYRTGRARLRRRTRQEPRRRRMDSRSGSAQSRASDMAVATGVYPAVQLSPPRPNPKVCVHLFFGNPMKNIFALFGLVKYALASVYMSRGERRRVRLSARKGSFATSFSAAVSALRLTSVSAASDVRAVGILCAIGIRNLLHDARAAIARERPHD
jgi:hypothetical protein